MCVSPCSQGDINDEIKSKAATKRKQTLSQLVQQETPSKNVEHDQWKAIAQLVMKES